MPHMHGPRLISGSPAGRAGRGGPPSAIVRTAPAMLERAVWEREMRRLRITVRLLTAILLALAARAIVGGINPTLGLTCAVVAVVLVASLLLTNYGRALEPDESDERRRSRARR